MPPAAGGELEDFWIPKYIQIISNYFKLPKYIIYQIICYVIIKLQRARSLDNFWAPKYIQFTSNYQNICIKLNVFCYYYTDMSVWGDSPAAGGELDDFLSFISTLKWPQIT